MNDHDHHDFASEITGESSTGLVWLWCRKCGAVGAVKPSRKTKLANKAWTSPTPTAAPNQRRLPKTRKYFTANDHAQPVYLQCGR